MSRKISEHQQKLFYDDTVPGSALPYRRTPFPLRKELEKEIHRQIDEDIIEEAEGPTPWVSPVVVTQRKSGAIRLCVDMRLASKVIKRERYPMPTLDDLVTDLNGASVFSRVDLNDAYHQVELDPESRHLTTSSTHMGLFRYKRLNMGISCASEIFQKIIAQILAGIPGVKNIQDDIIVSGRTQEEHDERLKLVFKRLADRNITLRQDKCEFNKPTLTFYGFQFSKSGVSADPQKVAAIAALDKPLNASEARSLLGMTNYCARFIESYANITEPIRRLAQKSVEWKWTDEQENAFQWLKQALSDSPVVGYFNLDKQTEIVVDARPVGMSAILRQYDSKSEDGYVVAYASCALSSVEQRYPQTDREGLAVLWGCEHFHLYIYGCPVTVVTDHKPLLGVFNNPK